MLLDDHVYKNRAQHRTAVQWIFGFGLQYDASVPHAVKPFILPEWVMIRWNRTAAMKNDFQASIIYQSLIDTLGFSLWFMYRRLVVLVLINDANWESEGEEHCQLVDGDNILLVSRLRRHWKWSLMCRQNNTYKDEARSIAKRKVSGMRLRQPGYWPCERT